MRICLKLRLAPIDVDCLLFTGISLVAFFMFFNREADVAFTEQRGGQAAILRQWAPWSNLQERAARFLITVRAPSRRAG